MEVSLAAAAAAAVVSVGSVSAAVTHIAPRSDLPAPLTRLSWDYLGCPRMKFGEILFRPEERAEASGPEGDGEGKVRAPGPRSPRGFVEITMEIARGK